MSIEVTVLVVLFLVITYVMGYLIGREQGMHDGAQSAMRILTAMSMLADDDEDGDNPDE